MTYVNERIRTVTSRTRADVTVGGWAALWLHGLREPFVDGTDGLRDLPVDLLAPRAAGVRPVRGARLRCFVDQPPPTVTVASWSVTDAVTSVLDSARWRRTPASALSVLDAGLRSGLVDREALVERVRSMPRLHGVRMLRATLGWASTRAESPMESVLRWWWLSCGIGWPLVNPEVYDTDGRFLGRPDLLDPASGLCAEYQGAPFHGSSAQRSADARRAQRFRAAGLTPVEIWATDLAAGSVGARLRGGLAAASARQRRVTVGHGEDLDRLRVGLVASSGWGEPVPASAPLERLWG